MTPSAHETAGEIGLHVDGTPIRVPAGITVAAALLRSGTWIFRRSVRGEPRGPVCGMGICFECRVRIDDLPQRRACMIMVREGMRVETDAASAHELRGHRDI